MDEVRCGYNKSEKQTSLSGYKETSFEAYEEVQQDKETRLEVVRNALRVLGEATDREIMDYLGVSDPNIVRPRRNDLVGLDEVIEVDRRICRVGGKRSIVWALK